MKQKFLNFALNTIRQNRKDIDEIKLDEIRYGLEAIYITITKAIFIFTLALILGIFKEMIILLILFNILRFTGFGLHATKSWICLLSSSLVFIVLPFVSKVIIIPLYIKTIICIISILLIYKNTPADTIKRPIVNKKRREFYKFITTINCVILSYISIIINNTAISNLIIFGILIEVALTSPLIYKLFNLSYNNYLNFKLD